MAAPLAWSTASALMRDILRPPTHPQAHAQRNHVLLPRSANLTVVRMELSGRTTWPAERPTFGPDIRDALWPVLWGAGWPRGEEKRAGIRFLDRRRTRRIDGQHQVCRP